MLNQPDYPLSHLLNHSLRLRGHHAHPLQGLMLNLHQSSNYSDVTVSVQSNYFQKGVMHYFYVDEPPRHSFELLGLLPASQAADDSVRHISIAEQPNDSSELHETLGSLVGCDYQRHYYLFLSQMCRYHHPYTYVTG